MFCIDGNKLNDKQKLVLLNTTHCFWIWQNWQNQKTQQNGTKSEPSIHLPSQWKCRRKALPARVSFCASFNLLDPLEACNVINVTWTHFIIISLSIHYQLSSLKLLCFFKTLWRPLGLLLQRQMCIKIWSIGCSMTIFLVLVTCGLQPRDWPAPKIQPRSCGVKVDQQSGSLYIS